MSFQPPEPESSLSVIPEATEENRGSSAFFFPGSFLLAKARGANQEEKPEAPVESMAMPTKLSSKEAEINEFRTMAMQVGKQPYSSCCCRLF